MSVGLGAFLTLHDGQKKVVWKSIACTFYDGLHWYFRRRNPRFGPLAKRGKICPAGESNFDVFCTLHDFLTFTRQWVYAISTA